MDAKGIEVDVEEGMAEGYIVWIDTVQPQYPELPVLEWFPNNGVTRGWKAVTLAGHPHGEALKSLGLWAGYNESPRHKLRQFSKHFTFPREWVSEDEDVKNTRAYDRG